MSLTQRLSVESGEQHEASSRRPRHLQSLAPYIGTDSMTVSVFASPECKHSLPSSWRFRYAFVRSGFGISHPHPRRRMIGPTAAAGKQSYPIAPFTFKRHPRTTNTLIGACLEQPITSFVGAALLHLHRRSVKRRTSKRSASRLNCFTNDELIETATN